MTLLSSSAPLPPEFRGAVIALGNFDGFHRGHQAVVGRAQATVYRSLAGADFSGFAYFTSSALNRG